GDALHAGVDAGKGAQPGAGRMAVTIDKARRYRHLLGIDDSGLWTDEVPDLVRAADSDEAPVLDGERLCARLRVINGVDVSVDHDQVRSGPRSPPIASRRRGLSAGRHRAQPQCSSQAGATSQELTSRHL